LAVDRVHDRASARDRLGLPADRFVIAVMGGSLGSGVLNRAVSDYVTGHRGDATLAIRHICGERFVAETAPATDGSDGILYDVIGFEPNMADLYAAADLLVGRGGASTVCEVAAVGIPSILVPWAEAAEDHQRANVAWLSDQGAAIVLDETELGAGALGATVDSLRSDPDRLRALGAKAWAAGAVHRSGALARLVEEVARG
jgi:UDP-N-acetylglucosamine--N-acetylmuramyl-(pentapeptide) pyrophosphoryl-undecaprenol N-acetylglucosamine transferase